MEYPEVGAIREAVRKHGLRFGRREEASPPVSIGYEPIWMEMQDKRWDLWVDNEFNDLEKMNPAVLLQLVLMEMRAYEEAEDFLVWAKDQGLDSSSERVRQIWFAWRDMVPELRGVFGKDLEGISDWDFYMGMGAIQTLRED